MPAILVPRTARAQFAPGQDQTNFRPGHHLTLSVSGHQSTWRIEDPLENRNVNGTGFQPGLNLRYGYHINVLKKFGFIVGTGAGLLVDRRTYGGYEPGIGLLFPSLAGGLVQNFVADMRCFVLAELSAIWFPYATRTEKNGSRTDISSIPNYVSVLIGLDRFTARNFALEAAFGWRGIYSNRLGQLQGGNASTQIVMRNIGGFLELGMTWQIGEEI